MNEGIEWTPIQYFNNKIICTLIEGDKHTAMSITALMDDCCQMAESTDSLLLKKMDDTFDKHEHYESYQTGTTKLHKDIPADGFMLKHYAGNVTYSVDGFLDKNRDTLFNDLINRFPA